MAAAYTERYRRNQDDIDDRLKEKYATNMREQHEKIPQITNALRGQDMRVDGSMNQWVWGGKASLPTGGPTGRGYEARNHNTTATKILKENLDASSVSSSSSSTENTSDEEEIDESQLSNKERKRRRRERKKKRKEQREQEQRRLEAERQKLVVQSVAAGVAVGAVAVAASVFLGNGRK